MDIRTQYNKIGKGYIEGQQAFFAKKEDNARKFIRKNLGNLKNKKVLDVGCGGGTDILFYEKLGADVYGIDPSKFMVNAAKKIIKQPNKIKIGGAEKIPFDKNFFDIVAGRFSLHYIKDLDKAYREIARVLKPNGLFVAIVNHPFDDLLRQRNKIYGNQEVLSARLYKNKVQIKFLSHIFSDYLSETFLKLFILRSFYENTDTGDKNKYDIKNIAVPSMLGFKATKR